MKIIFLTNSGFHLIEILITLVLVSVLTAIAIPVYTQHIVHAKRLEAAGMLSKLAIAMEKFHIENNSYQKATLNKLRFPKIIVSKQYELLIQSADDDDYLIVAKPLGYQAEKDVECGSLMMNSFGEKMVTGSRTVDECW